MVIYKGSRYPLWAFMTLPCTLFAGSFGAYISSTSCSNADGLM